MSLKTRIVRMGVLVLWLIIGNSPLVSAQGFDSLGNAKFSSIACPTGGLSDGSCYKADIGNCGRGKPFTARIKVNKGDGSKGVVFFITGGGGTNWYDNNPAWSTCSGGNCGFQIVSEVNVAGYTTVQLIMTDKDNSTAEPAGWLTGKDDDGPRALACRYATVVNQVWNQQIVDSEQPFCATGNSGGAAAIAYALTQYGLGSKEGPGPLLNFAEITSGPPMARLDYGCNVTPPRPAVQQCQGRNINYLFAWKDALAYIDPPYTGRVDGTVLSRDVCADRLRNGSTDLRSQWLHDSIVSEDFAPPYVYDTVVKAAFGSKDFTSAVSLGHQWFDQIQSSKQLACVVGGSHDLPGSDAGANQIADDLLSLCRY